MVVLVGVLIAFSTGPIYFVAQHVFRADGMWESRPIKGGFVAAGLLGLAVWLSNAIDRRLKKLDIPLVLGAMFTLTAITSTAWSILPRQTLWRSWVYVAMLMVAWSLASLTFNRLWMVLTAFSGLATAVSVVVVIVRPHMGVTDDGLWRGIYTSPNSLGPVCAILIICLAGRVMMDTDIRVRLASVAGAVAAVVPLVMSNSTTSALALVIGVGASMTVWTASRFHAAGKSRAAMAVALCSATAAAIMIGVGGPIIAGTSGIRQRSEVWSIVWERIMIKPWLGYGFFTYWGTPTSMHPRAIGRAGSAHNSVLEAGLDMGIIGMTIVAAMVAAAIWFSVRRLMRDPSRHDALLAALAIFVGLSHMTESFVSWFSYMWILLIVTGSGSHDRRIRRDGHTQDDEATITRPRVRDQGDCRS